MADYWSQWLFVAGLAGLYILLTIIARRMERKAPPPLTRPWDWRIDGECENASHPRVLP